MQDPESMEVWKKSHQLTVDVYRTTDTPPFHRRWALIDQIQKSVLSVESNITEGATRDNDAEFLRFLRYALSSAFELRTQILVARDLGYMNTEDHQRHSSLLEEVRKMLWGLMETLKRSLGRHPRA
jgi:four helix bundle protein